MRTKRLFFVCAVVAALAAMLMGYSNGAGPAEFVPALQKGMSWEIVGYRLVNVSHSTSGLKFGTAEIHLQYKVEDYTARDGKHLLKISVYLDDPSRVPKVPAGQAIGWYIIDGNTRRVKMAVFEEGGRIPEDWDSNASVDGERPAFFGTSLPLEMPVWPDMGKTDVPYAASEIVYPVAYSADTTVTQSLFFLDLPGPSGPIHSLSMNLTSASRADKLPIGCRTQLWVQGVPWWVQWRSVSFPVSSGQLGRVIYARLSRWQDADGKVHEIPQGQLPLGIFP